MSRKSRNQTSSEDKAIRVDRIIETLTNLEKEKKLLEELDLAPVDSWVARYQVRQPKKTYWYYKLQAQVPSFPRAEKPEKLSKYKHLGKAGSQAHVEAILAVCRRGKIEQLQRAIDALIQALQDAGYDAEVDEHP